MAKGGGLKGQTALITGASAGIGAATAKALAESGCNLILTARRMDRLKKLKTELGKKVSVEIFPLDVSKKSEIEKFAKEHSKALSKVDILINNAGLAKGMDPVQKGALEDWDVMIDTNIKGLLYLTRQVLPFMIEKKSGHILNMGSVAGRWTYPNGNVYAATKFFVRGISESIRLDTLGSGVRVTNIEPGMVETEFSEVRLQDKAKAKKVYEGLTPLTAEDIADSIVWSLSRPAHVNIQELVIFPTDQASVTHSFRR